MRLEQIADKLGCSVQQIYRHGLREGQSTKQKADLLYTWSGDRRVVSDVALKDSRKIGNVALYVANSEVDSE